MRKVIVNMNNIRKAKEEKGITLIALVITIIVLLILAGVTIATLTGDNGILTQAGKAKEETRGASVEEAKDLWKINQKADNYTENGTAETLEELINNLVNQKLLTEDEKDQILGNDSKGIEATYKVTIGSRLIIFKEKYIADYLKAGEYVYYPQENGEPIKCIVLYDTDYNNINGKNYGVQIITTDIVESVTIGAGSIDVAYESYNNAIDTLNTRAMAFLNTNYATSARCVGSVPDNPSQEASDYCTGDDIYMSKINGILKNSDSNYLMDSEQMKNLNIHNIGKNYWMASRCLSWWGNTKIFALRNYDTVGRMLEGYIIGVYSSGNPYPYCPSFGLRPVFTLRPSVYIIDGTGTKDDPYVLRT